MMHKNMEIVLKRNFGAAVNSQSTCSNDMRDRMPGCHQLGSMWCWATSIASAMEYYGTASAEQCVGVECQVVSWTYNEDCCPFKSMDDACGSQGAYMSDILRAVNHFTPATFTRSTGPLDKATLDAALQGGSPVIMGIGSRNSPDHIVTLHGCGGGKYYYHDPERDYNEFIEVDYDWLHNQCVVWMHNGGNPILVPCIHGSPKQADEIFRVEKKWFDTVYVPGSVVV